jgi:hypothetical protein
MDSTPASILNQSCSVSGILDPIPPKAITLCPNRASPG